MLRYHDEHGTLLEHCAGTRHLPETFALLASEPDASQQAPTPKLRLSEKEMHLEGDSSALSPKNVRRTYKVGF